MRVARYVTLALVSLVMALPVPGMLSTAMGAEPVPAAPKAVRGLPSEQGVPRGRIFSFQMNHSKIYPGTTRKITVYVPAEYNARKPACVMVELDALILNLKRYDPISYRTFDNLIYKKQMPVTIAIGVSPGAVASIGPPGNNPRFNRSCEGDSMNGNFGRFLIDEVLPAVEKHRTPGGLPIRLTNNPNDRAICGESTGAIGAFTVAWHHPNAFRRVFSIVGTYVDMRGGERYPTLIRKTMPKPLRVFITDNNHDVQGSVGDWWLANHRMYQALKYSGYAVRRFWGVGGHSATPADTILPHVLRWLWKDWKKPIQAGSSQNWVLQSVLAPHPVWRVVASGFSSSGSMAVDPKGHVFLAEAKNGDIYRLHDHAAATVFAQGLPPEKIGIAFGPKGHLYAVESQTGRVVVFNSHGVARTIAHGIDASQLVINHTDDMYAAGSRGTGRHSGTIWRIQPDGQATVVAGGLRRLTGLAFTPDGHWLCAAWLHNHFGYSFQVLPNGTLRYGQNFYYFERPYTSSGSRTGELCMDRQGWLYAATVMGVEILDRNGRTQGIVPVPGETAVTAVTFGGQSFHTLYALSRGKIYAMTMKNQGAPCWLPPITLPPWAPW